MKVPKPFNGGEWSAARKTSFIKSALRSARWPVKFKALKAAETTRKTNTATGRLAMHYKCAHCLEDFPAKGVQVDHILPVVPLFTPYTWDEVIKRMFCEIEGFQVLCRPCHKIKTNAENAKRKKS